MGRSNDGEVRATEWFKDHGTDKEMRWEADDGSHCTPNDRFFVRNHTTVPRIDPTEYRLQVYGDGLDGEPTLDDAATFTLDEIKAMEAETVTFALECTGNGRSFFAIQQETPRPGTQWGLGAIGVARWGGVWLRDLLAVVGLRESAVSVLATGLDPPYIEDGVDYGRVRRPLPITKALDDVRVVYEMNGEPLPPEHGYPLRLLVPGWVGVASIKWLGSLEVSTEDLQSPWTTTFYTVRHGENQVPLTEMPVKSTLALARNHTFRLREEAMLHGRAWSGGAAIDEVEVSVDGGSSWQSALLCGPNEPKSWVLWELPWTPTEPGRHELMVRATDDNGVTQPDTIAPNDQGYLFWAVVRHPVEVV